VTAAPDGVSANVSRDKTIMSFAALTSSLPVAAATPDVTARLSHARRTRLALPETNSIFLRNFSTDY